VSSAFDVANGTAKGGDTQAKIANNPEEAGEVRGEVGKVQVLHSSKTGFGASSSEQK
jgi:hypothetical protein